MPVTLAVPLPVPVLVLLLEGVPVELPVCEPVWLCVPDALAAALCVQLGDREPVELLVTDAELDALLELVPVPLHVPDALPDALPETVRVAEAVLLPKPRRRLATLSPRYVSRASVASTDSPLVPPPAAPPAASHSSADSYTPDDMPLAGTSCVTLTYRKQPAEPCHAAPLASNA